MITTVTSFSSLPSDIISEIVDKQLLNGITEQSFDSDPFPAILLVSGTGLLWHFLWHLLIPIYFS
jgi:hypothetical protein